jgi:SAM-dependent methyltransferase
MNNPHSPQWRCLVCNHAQLIESANQVSCPQCGHLYSLNKGVWECAEGFTPSGFTPDRNEHLQALEKEHFWFDARDGLLCRILQRLRRPGDKHLLELGCGSGRMLARLESAFAVTLGVEGHVNALAAASDRCNSSQLIHSDVLNTPLADGQFDWVVAFDVLEHVDSARFLREALRLVRPGGLMLLSVPAFPLLWSQVDELAGHRCRYRSLPLKNELVSSGWLPLGHTHFQFLLFPLLAASRLLNRKSNPTLERQPPKVLNRMLGFINQLELSLFHRFSLPFGSSLIMWAEKPLTDIDS